uniref:Chemokine interleukin-8-like domain-containing protein n=1 Tax=Anguilla anguilla TaxID=7936 RepID=A0A0E9X1C6_ANGAN
MKTSLAILSALLLAVAIVSTNKARSRGGCCMVYSKEPQLRKLSLNKIKEHRMQEITGNCNIPAVVFITQRNQRICANPKAKSVKRILKRLSLGKKNKKQDTRRKGKQ